MKYFNLVRKNGFFDFTIISIVSSSSFLSKEYIDGTLIILLYNIYNKLIQKKFDDCINKEYLLIIINILNFFDTIKILKKSSLIILFCIFLFINKLLIKLQLGSKLIISNFILKELKNDGKYLSENFSTGNAVELFIIQSIFLLNTLLLISKSKKYIIDYFMIILGLFPIYIITKNFLFLWYHFVQCLYLFFFSKIIYLFFYWIFILSLFFYINNTYIQNLYLKKIIRRKIYHFLGFIVLVPGILFFDKTVLKLILMIVSYLFIIVEILRNLNFLYQYKIIQNLNDFMKKNIDERDDNNFIVTHIFLMTGLISSLYYNNKNNIYNYLSIIILSIGDSMCSICGISFGKNNIYSLNNRTLEGSLGGFASSIIIYMILKRDFINIEEFFNFLFVFLYEGYTLEIDNLVLPLFVNNLFINSDLIKNKIFKFFNL